MKKTINHSSFVINFWMIFLFIVYCLRLRIDPSKFFQLNADYFNKEKGIYSKLEINQLIPFRWRLKQIVYSSGIMPTRFPVFLKPEWGQNSNGIYRADSPEEFKEIQRIVAKKDMTYLLQEAADENREFEVYYIRQADHLDHCATLTITEVKNQRDGNHPINGVKNAYTSYTDLTQEFTDIGLQTIWNHVKSIGNFRMARVCIKANSEIDLLKGEFHIVEINLLTPMPIHLLDQRVPWKNKMGYIKNGMWLLAENAQAISTRQESKKLFLRKLGMHYRVKS
jgi:hypothetical protein